MIKPLLIATKENAEILKHLCKKGEKDPTRRQIGTGWHLRRFIEADLKNYNRHTHMVFDVFAFVEKGEEFIALLEKLKADYEKDVVIIIFSIGNYDLNFFDSLVRRGFTNIVADYPDKNEAERANLVKEDLIDCFSDNGLPKEKYSRFLIERESETDAISNEENTDTTTSDLSEIDIHLYLYGSQNRIGVTTLAISLCEYVVGQNGKAALVLCTKGRNREFKQMRDYFKAAETDNMFSINGFDVYNGQFYRENDKYNLIAFDCGYINENMDTLNSAKKGDKILLCAGIGWKELDNTVNSQQHFVGVEYTTVVNTADAEACKAYESQLCRNGNDYLGIDFRGGDYSDILI